MAAKNKIRTVLSIGLVLAILLILTWRLAPSGLFYPIAIVAALFAATTLFVLLRVSRTASRSQSVSRNPAPGAARPVAENSASPEEDGSSFPGAPDDSLPKIYQRGHTLENTVDSSPNVGATTRYFSMSADTRVDDSTLSQLTGKNVIGQSRLSAVNPTDHPAKPVQTAQPSTASSAEDAMPLTGDESSLTAEEKNRLVNAVWYRCENPYCKYTHFLDIHYIVDEKSGGTNTLDNLIVLCPYCHNLAHKQEIPEYKMREWIANREERFRFHIDWPY